MVLFILSCVSIKEVRNGYKGGGCNVFIAKYNFNLSYIFIKQIYFPILFCQKWLDKLHNMTISFLFRLPFSRTSLPYRSQKQQIVE